MASTSSITMQSLRKIVRREPAVGAKTWCLSLFFCLSRSESGAPFVQWVHSSKKALRCRLQADCDQCRAFFTRDCSFRCTTESAGRCFTPLIEMKHNSVSLRWNFYAYIQLIRGRFWLQQWTVKKLSEPCVSWKYLANMWKNSKCGRNFAATLRRWTDGAVLGVSIALFTTPRRWRMGPSHA